MTDPAVAVAVSVSTARAPSAYGLLGGNALDAAQAAFETMMSGEAPLTLDGMGLGTPFPARDIDLIELRNLLLDHRTGVDAWDLAWAELVRRSRASGPDWVLGSIGVALPGLKAIAARATSGMPTAPSQDIVSEELTAFVSGLATVDLSQRAIVTRLNWHARRAAARARHSADRELARDPTRLENSAFTRRDGHVDLVLNDAVRRGVVTALEARIILTTRLERVACARVAANLGLSYEALMKRRRRAETRLADDLAIDPPEDPMSRNRV